MPFCKECGLEIPQDAKFCLDCGTPVVKTGGSRKKQVSSQDFDDKTQARSKPQEYGKVTFDSIPEGYVITDRYEVKEKIGQGGFGAVYRCYDRNMNIDKALKIIPEVVSTDKEAMFDLQQEAQTMIALNHSNIVRVYDFHKTGEIKFIDMEYIDGKNLSEMKLDFSGKKIPEAQVKEYALKIAEGMAYAHSKGVLHKDLKPHNIKVTSDGSVKIMDFGIAETVRTSMSRLDHSSSSGTLVYMSPEQLTGSNVGREADIYSFAASLYELLSGHPPFYKGDIQYQIINKAPEPLTNISSPFNDLLLKCLEKDYKNRFRNFNEVVSVLGGKTLPEQDEKIDEPQQKIAPEKEKKPDKISYADKTDTAETAKKSSIPTIPIAIGLAVLLIGIIAAVIISQSTARIPVPDVVGMYYDEAEELLHQNGLTAQLRERQKSFTEPTNKVSAQFPAAGSEIRRRSAVRLNVYERWVKVPAVSDLTESAAKSRLQEAGFTVKEVASDFHPTIASDRIIEIQDSPAELKEGSQVVLVKSKGIEMVDFPDLSGMSLAEAKAKLQSLGLRAGRESIIESNIDEAGRIVRTDPTSRRIAKGSSIDLFVSLGNVVLPDLSGFSVSDAKSRLASLGLQVGDEKIIESDIDEAGRIVRTSPAGGKMSKGSRIDLYVSLGNVVVPDLTGKTEAEAQAELESLGLKLGGISNKGVRDKQLHKKVFDQSKQSRSKIPINSSIDITINQYVPEGMVLVEGGTFQMGSNDGHSDEKPVHRVTVSDFYIGKYPVTQREYRSIMGTNPSHSDRGIGDNHPVNRVSWYDAIEYCNKLSEREGLTPVYSIGGDTSPRDWSSGTITADWSADGYRLPTEAEWEYAARGGKNSRGFTYSGSDDIDEVAWYFVNSGDKIMDDKYWTQERISENMDEYIGYLLDNNNKTHPVGSKKSNELGIYDMSGNVFEWCWDWYGSYSSGAKTNPRGPQSGSTRVLRGGSWADLAVLCRVGYRYFINATVRYINFGFRVSRGLK